MGCLGQGQCHRQWQARPFRPFATLVMWLLCPFSPFILNVEDEEELKVDNGQEDGRGTMQSKLGALKVLDAP